MKTLLERRFKFSVIESWMTGEEIYELNPGCAYLIFCGIWKYPNNLQVLLHIWKQITAEMADLGIEFTSLTTPGKS